MQLENDSGKSGEIMLVHDKILGKSESEFIINFELLNILIKKINNIEIYLIMFTHDNKLSFIYQLGVSFLSFFNRLEERAK